MVRPAPPQAPGCPAPRSRHSFANCSLSTDGTARPPRDTHSGSSTSLTLRGRDTTRPPRFGAAGALSGRTCLSLYRDAHGARPVSSSTPATRSAAAAVTSSTSATSCAVRIRRVSPSVVSRSRCKCSGTQQPARRRSIEIGAPGGGPGRRWVGPDRTPGGVTLGDRSRSTERRRLQVHRPTLPMSGRSCALVGVDDAC